MSSYLSLPSEIIYNVQRTASLQNIMLSDFCYIQTLEERIQVLEEGFKHR